MVITLKNSYKSTPALWTTTDTPITRTATKSHAKINYRCLTKINSRYYGLSLMRSTVTNQSSLQCPLHKGSWLFMKPTTLHIWSSKYVLCYKSLNRRSGNAAFFGVQKEYTPLKSFPLQSSLNYVAHVPFYELLYPEEGSIAKTSVKTLVTASNLQFSN